MNFSWKIIVLWNVVNVCKLNFTLAVTILTGFSGQLICPHDGRNNNYISWNKGVNQLTFEKMVTANAFPDLKPRLSVTGNHTIGEYHLSISDVRKGDEGEYWCRQKINSDKSVHQLSVIVSPTNVLISNVQDNKIEGTEGHKLRLQCTATGGDPSPDVKLMIAGNVVNTAKQSVTYITQALNRSYDGQNVTCIAGYISLMTFPLEDSVKIQLKLIPLTPVFSPEQVITEETNALSVTCTSIGSRPAPTKRIWMIGVTDVTSHSTDMLIIYHQSTDTYITSSTLTYKFNRQYNQENLTCGYMNAATDNKFIASITAIKVLYTPVVTVKNSTFDMFQQQKVIQCEVDGNPGSYTFHKWQHRSKYGQIIRVFDGTYKLTLPLVSEVLRYQDTGEYVCTVSNGIKDTQGNLNQNGSGYITNETPPRILNGSSQTQYVELDKSVSIDVSVYSVPKYIDFKWLINGNILASSNRYIAVNSPAVFNDVFYGTNVQVDGYRFVLTIFNLNESGVTTYTLQLSNGVGQPVQHSVVLTLRSEVPCTVVQSEIIVIVACIFSTVVIILLISNAVSMYKLLNGCRKSKPTLSVRYSPEKSDSVQEAYYNVEDIQAQEEEEDTKCNYEALRPRDKPSIYEELNNKATGDPAEKNVFGHQLTFKH